MKADNDFTPPFTIQLWIHPMSSVDDLNRPLAPSLADNYPTLEAALKAVREDVDWNFWTPEIMDRDGRVMTVPNPDRQATLP